MIYPRIAGTGSEPPGAYRHELRARTERGDQRCVDPGTHRHPPAPHRRRGGVHLRPRRARNAPRARVGGDRSDGARPHRRGHNDPGPHLPFDRMPPAGAPRRRWMHRVRRAGSVHGLHLRPGNRREVLSHRQRPPRACGRRRHPLPTARLVRPHDVRAFRRRRRSGGARSVGVSRRDVDAPACGRQLRAAPLRRRRHAARRRTRRGRRSVYEDAGQRSLQGCGAYAAPDCRRDAGRERDGQVGCRLADFPIRRTFESSRRRPASSACRWTR